MRNREIEKSSLARRMLPIGLPALAIAACISFCRSVPEPGPALVISFPRAGGAGAGLGRVELGAGPADPRPIVQGFSEIGGIAASFDGRSLIFAGRKIETDPFEIWEMASTGGSPRRVTKGGECLDPAFLPDGRIAYARPAAGGSSAIHVASRDGTGEQRITFGGERDRRPAVIPDGRIVFLRSHAGGKGNGSDRIMTVNPDGTGLGLLSEPSRGSAVEAGPWVAGGRVIFAESAGGAERLVSVSPRDPIGSREILPTSDRLAESLRLSCFKAPDLPPSWKEGLTELAIAVPRPRPPILTSVVDEKKTAGTLLCLDVYASGLPGVAGAERGSIGRVKIFEAAGALLGEAPVEPDGSFFIQVPADVPLILELLGPEGPLGRDGSGIWVRPNENRGCIGCHEDPELSPENRVPLAMGREASSLSGRAPFPSGAAGPSGPGIASEGAPSPPTASSSPGRT